jgi:eukaryotic-like serine/threonine-protein kinase
MKAGDLVGGKYRLVRRLGQGAMGVVWEAVHEVTARKVAMKLIVNATDNLRLRLLREARAAGKISHRNVVEVYDIGETEEQDPFLVMQLLIGETLYAIGKREGPLDMKRGITIARDIARALVAAHSQGIIHRDLKPANVFMHREAGSSGEIVKVLDFGLCKPMGDSEMLTTPGGMLGSPAYMAPEQILGVADIDPRTDIWALGVLAFEMFAGKRPFQGRGPDLIHAVLKDPIPRLRDVVQGMDPDLDEVIAGCIVRDRNARFTQAADIVARLEVLAERAERAEGRTSKPSEEENDLGVTQVYRPGSHAPAPSYQKVGKTIPMMSANIFRPSPPTTDSAPQSGPGGNVANPPWASGGPSSQPSPNSQQPLNAQNMNASMGLAGTAVITPVPDPAMQWRQTGQGYPQAPQGLQHPGFQATTGQNPMYVPPFPGTGPVQPKQLRPWVAVAMGIGIGLLALLAIIVALSLSTKNSSDSGSRSPKSATSR